MPLYQVSLKQSWLNQQLRNIFYYETSGELDASQSQELADAIRAAHVSSTLAAYLDNGWALNGIDLRRVDVAGFLGTDWGFTSGSWPGASTGDPVPTQIAMLVLGSGVTTRPNRVRSYLGGFTETFVGADGLFTSAALAAGVAFIAAMDSLSVTGDTATRQAAQWSSPAATYVVDWNPLTTYEGTAIPATQRRRRIGRGI